MKHYNTLADLLPIANLFDDYVIILHGGKAKEFKKNTLSEDNIHTYEELLSDCEIISFTPIFTDGWMTSGQFSEHKYRTAIHIKLPKQRITITSGDTIIAANKDYKGSYLIPEKISKLSPYAFKDCVGLTYISINNNIKEIPTGAFQGCSGLSSIYIPATVTKIDADAFNGCNAEIVFENSSKIEYIGTNALSTNTIIHIMQIKASALSYKSFEDCKIDELIITGDISNMDVLKHFNCIKSIDISSNLAYKLLQNQMNTEATINITGD